MTDSDWRNACNSTIGREETCADALSPMAANCLLATLNDETRLSVGDSMPALFHWLYFNKPVSTNRLKADGHEIQGEFLPPVRYPHRMWAGSRIDFHYSLFLGEPAERRSTIKSIEFKTGSSGSLCFVNVEHVYRQQDRLCITDVHTIVYREETGKPLSSTAASSADPIADSDSQSLDSIVLFRYSALTFNSHRIHYDHDYCRDVEGYPGLVVHGPLMATLLIRHLQASQPQQSLTNFSFRGRAPVFAGEQFRLATESSADTGAASLIKKGGTIAMSATGNWAS